MDRITQIAQTLAASTVVLALIYIIHELLQALDASVSPSSIARELPDQVTEQACEGVDTRWQPDRVIRSAGTPNAYAPSAGD